MLCIYALLRLCPLGFLNQAIEEQFPSPQFFFSRKEKNPALKKKKIHKCPLCFVLFKV